MPGTKSGRATKRTVPIGVVFSQTGSYRTIGTELLRGTLLAIEEVNATSAYGFRLEPQIEDPGGDLNEYRERCDRLLRTSAIRHVVGCYTSSSRKEVIPVFEKRDGLLWYPSHYEGFESCNNVIYTGASPNQHIVPLIVHMLQAHGSRAYCIGSNYIWAWECNRIMREIICGCGGGIVAERYLPVGSVDVEHIVDDIAAQKPDFIFSSLIGVSSHAFMEAFHAARVAQPALGPARMPICSVTLSEPELRAVPPAAADGHIASSVYFQSKRTAANDVFVAAFKRRFGAGCVTSADAEAAYIAVRLLAQAIERAQSSEIERVKQALAAIELEAPQGPVRVDPANNHCCLTPSLGRSNPDGQFEILWSAPSPVRPDPYLVGFDIARFRAGLAATIGDVPTAAGQRLRVIR